MIYNLTLVGTSQGQVKLTLPDHAVLNGNINGQCSIEGNKLLHIAAFPSGKCRYKTIRIQKNSTFSVIEFVTKNVTRSCTYRCLIHGQPKKKKTVSVVSKLVFVCVATYM